MDMLYMDVKCWTGGSALPVMYIVPVNVKSEFLGGGVGQIWRNLMHLVNLHNPTLRHLTVKFMSSMYASLADRGE